MATKIQWNATPTLYIIIAISLLTLPIRWVAAWFLAVAVHESAHYIALRSMGCSVFSVVLGAAGVKMNTVQLNGWKEVLCSAAGPLMSLSLGFLGSIFPRLALCGFAQGIYNLLPIYPMDGGRILNGILGRFRFGKAVGRAVEVSVLLGLWILAIYGWLHLSLGPLPLVLFALMLLRTRKIPCKAGQFAVQ